MKRKSYKVTIKIKYETSMLHSQTSAIKAQEDVSRVFSDLLKQDEKIKGIFELPPHITCKAVINDERQ